MNMIDEYMYVRSEKERLRDDPPLDFKGKVIVWIGYIICFIGALLICRWFEVI